MMHTYAINCLTDFLFHGLRGYSVRDGSRNGAAEKWLYGLIQHQSHLATLLSCAFNMFACHLTHPMRGPATLYIVVILAVLVTRALAN